VKRVSVPGDVWAVPRQTNTNTKQSLFSSSSFRPKSILTRQNPLMASMQVRASYISAPLSDLVHFIAGHQMFEALLKEVVQAKRLSASKMTKLTEIAMKSLPVRRLNHFLSLLCLITWLFSHIA
jgi:hypothetical protein